ncbi:MAG TPA: sigma factor-like helix-turn-helix DNA-binding protein [Thermoanaerobaculia bacterium]|nr:sigma factor-like helix-turn-helix DNA-binding protein [Thermoanaerobaculia bacterium]
MGTSIVFSPVGREAETVWKCARQRLMLVSPWLKAEAVRDVARHSPLPMDQWQVVTLGRVQDFREGASDLEAFSLLVQQGADIKIVRGLHAKIYVADRSIALFGSANLTVAGMGPNAEVAAITDDSGLVGALSNETELWHSRGRRIDHAWIEQVHSCLTSSSTEADLLVEESGLEGPDISIQATPETESSQEPDLGGAKPAYAQYPLPSSWLTALGVLLPKPPSQPQLQPLEALDTYVDQVLARLTERERRVLNERLGLQRTLQEIGDSLGCTRERVRQIERKALAKAYKRNANSNRAFAEALGQWLRVTERPLIRTHPLPEGPASASTLRLALGIFSEIASLNLDARETPTAWVLLERADEAEIRAQLEKHFEEPQFIARADLSLAVGFGEECLDSLALLPDSKLRSLFGYYGWHWSKQDCMLAVARHLASAGHLTWHISEMARALEFHSPADFAEFSPHDVGGILQRPDLENLYEHAGQAGIWRLQEYGDGHRNTLEAVKALLRSSPSPMHSSDIHANLQRPVSRDALAALLRNNPSSREFTAFGDAIFGLSDSTYGTSEDFRALEAWLMEHVEEGVGISVASLKDLARADGRRFDCLIGVAKISEKLEYRPGWRGLSTIWRA